jgi:hypothetical protein
MALPALEILYIIETIFYTPALLVSLFVMKKHGAGKQLGWKFLTMVWLFRLIGAATGIAALHESSQSLIEASDIIQSFGLSSILAAAIGISMRVDDKMGRTTSPRDYLGLSALLSLLLSLSASLEPLKPSTMTHPADLMVIPI